MRIVQLLTRPQRRGAEIFALQLSEALREMGHKVLVITLLSGDAELPFEGEIIHLNRPDSKAFDLTGFWELKRVLDTFKPDLVQANASDTLRYGVGAKILSNSSFRLVYRNANMMSPFVKNRWTKSFYKFLLNQSDGIISVANASKEDLVQFYGYSKRISVIPIGIKSEGINRLTNEGFDSNLPKNFLLFMGGLVPEKDPELIMSWFCENCSKWPDLSLIFLGKGVLEERLKAKIKEFKLEERVLLIPNQINPFPILKKAKALVLPSKIEGLPAVILEAMYCRVPVISFGVGGILEVLQTGKTGWCITPGDKTSFVNAIEEVLSIDPKAKNQILDQAFELVNSHYTLPQIALQFEIFYKKLLSPNTPSNS